MKKFRYDSKRALDIAQRIIKAQEKPEELLKLADELRSYAQGAQGSPEEPVGMVSDSRGAARDDYDPRARMENRRDAEFEATRARRTEGQNDDPRARMEAERDAAFNRARSR